MHRCIVNSFVISAPECNARTKRLPKICAKYFNPKSRARSVTGLWTWRFLASRARLTHPLDSVHLFICVHMARFLCVPGGYVFLSPAFLGKSLFPMQHDTFRNAFSRRCQHWFGIKFYCFFPGTAFPLPGLQLPGSRLND